MQKCADMVTKNSKIADIGTDHAYLPIYLALNKKISFALACDLREGPLKIAQKNISGYNLSGIISTRISDGLENINENDRVSILMVTHDPYSASYASRILFIKNYILFDCQIVNITIPCTIVTCHNEFYLLIAKSVCYIFNRIFCRITSAIVERSFFLTAYI